MADNLSSNKRIAKNTMMLYIRMLLSIVVSLYTSRVVLNTLGVEDYGIYGVVGGVVAMFSFLNASMSGATSRFLTYEMGRGDMQRLHETFSSALIVHIIIAGVVFILAETIGLWFLINKLVIPENRMFAAHVVYQLSIFSTMVSISQVPYNATIISHEKMDVYAYVELLNVTLKLLIVFLLPILGQDKLIVYAALVLGESFLIAMIYRMYCYKNYVESHFSLVYKKDIIFPMLSFSSWDLYGNMSFSWRQQGINFLINIFFGPVLNAASSIATTIQGIILGLSGNVTMAYRPQIIKNYASQNYEKVNNLLQMAVKLTLVLFLMIVIPIFIEINIVLKLWLGTVPKFTADFFRLVIISSVFSLINNVLTIPIHASGKIKKLSFLTGSLFLFSLLPMYLGLKIGYSPNFVYVVVIVFSILALLSNCFILKGITKFIEIRVIAKEVIKILILSSIIFILLYNISRFLDFGLLRLLLVSILSIFLYVICFLGFLINKKQRSILYQRILRR